MMHRRAPCYMQYLAWLVKCEPRMKAHPQSNKVSHYSATVLRLCKPMGMNGGSFQNIQRYNFLC